MLSHDPVGFMFAGLRRNPAEQRVWFVNHNPSRPRRSAYYAYYSTEHEAEELRWAADKDNARGGLERLSTTGQDLSPDDMIAGCGYSYEAVEVMTHLSPIDKAGPCHR
jgi:hypothetical protein